MRPSAQDLDALRWYAVRVRSNGEKSVVRSLVSRQLAALLPIYSVRRRWSDRIKALEMPLFPGYVFSQFPLRRELEVRRIGGVKGLVGFDGPEPVPETDIQAIQRLIDSGQQLEPWPYLTVGDRVRILTGPLAGVEGIFVEDRAHARVVVSIDFLRRSVAATVARNWVEPAAPVLDNMIISRFEPLPDRLL